MKKVGLSQLKENLPRYLRQAEKEQIVITRRGQPVGVLIGFGTQEEWFDYHLENDPAFLRRMARARRDLRAGRGTRIEDLAR